MRLKPAGIIAILAIIGVLLYFVLKPKIDTIRAENSKDINTTTTQSSSPPRDTTPAPTTGGNNREERSFNYTPEEPQNGQLRGVVEVGATGFNSFVINMDEQGRWKIVSKDFGESLAYEGLS